MFAVALTLVVLVSTAVLLYQFWAGSLLTEDITSTDAAAAPDVVVSTSTFHIDRAA